jgi:hypothetical protein
MIAEVKHMLQNANESNIRDIQYDVYTLEEDLKQWEQIKQDLEVLEILKEQYDGECSEEEMFGASCVEDKNRKWICLTISTDNEKYNKVKQWLEENENDR